jgi:two-component sensor histidine kinase
MWAKHLAACGVVSASLPLAFTLQSLVPLAYPYLPFLLAVLLAGSVFDQGSGYVAVGLSALFAAWLFLPPVGYPDVHEGRDGVPLALFVALGTATAAVMEALHHAVVRERRAHADLARSERQRRLLLSEFRHRTRNDLQSLAALLLLRARSAPSQAAADGLREAAEHARAHAWLAHGDTGDDASPGRVDTKEFVEGFCRDLGRALLGGELRPIALIATAEAHTLDSERAVHLGLALNELVTNALKYAFPDEGAGTVRVRFAREGRASSSPCRTTASAFPPTRRRCRRGRRSARSPRHRPRHAAAAGLGGAAPRHAVARRGRRRRRHLRRVALPRGGTGPVGPPPSVARRVAREADAADPHRALAHLRAAEPLFDLQPRRGRLRQRRRVGRLRQRPGVGQAGDGALAARPEQRRPESRGGAPAVARAERPRRAEQRDTAARLGAAASSPIASRSSTRASSISRRMPSGTAAQRGSAAKASAAYSSCAAACAARRPVRQARAAVGEGGGGGGDRRPRRIGRPGHEVGRRRRGRRARHLRAAGAGAKGHQQQRPAAPRRHQGLPGEKPPRGFAKGDAGSAESRLDALPGTGSEGAAGAGPTGPRPGAGWAACRAGGNRSTTVGPGEAGGKPIPRRRSSISRAWAAPGAAPRPPVAAAAGRPGGAGFGTGPPHAASATAAKAAASDGVQAPEGNTASPPARRRRRPWNGGRSGPPGSAPVR